VLPTTFATPKVIDVGADGRRTLIAVLPVLFNLLWAKNKDIDV